MSARWPEMIVYCAVALLSARFCAGAELGLGDPLWQPSSGPADASSGVELFKKIEEDCRTTFLTADDWADARTVLGDDEAAKTIVRDAVLFQVWAGIRDFSPEYFAVLRVASRYQRMRGCLVRRALREREHGLSAFDAQLIIGGSRVVDAYDPFLFAWLDAVQSPASRALAKRMEEGGDVPQELLNHYTIIVEDGAGSYKQVPYAIYFAEEFKPLLKAVDEWIETLRATPAANATEKQAYIDYLLQYRACMSETDIALLEPACAEVDVRWMALRGWVQVVHDLETGYGDPLRSKMQPEFSVRLLDSSQAAANEQIQHIKAVIVGFFRKRGTPLARDGLAALSKASSGIYYHPFLGGFNMQFRSIGQSVPNRADVRNNYGVKMFFDVVAVEGKQGPTRVFAAKVLADASLIDRCMNATETTVWQTAGHELGHAVYNLNGLPPGGAPQDIAAPMEEARADTTALQVLLLMLRAGQVTQADAGKYVCGWLIDQVRRFPEWGSGTLQGYIMSAAAMWAWAADVGLARINSQGRVELDLSKAEAWLEASAELFAELLDAEDLPSPAGSAAALEGLWRRSFVAAGNSAMVQHLVSVLAQQADGASQQLGGLQPLGPHGTVV